jgi:hypothetical protein
LVVDLEDLEAVLLDVSRVAVLLLMGLVALPLHLLALPLHLLVAHVHPP